MRLIPGRTKVRIELFKGITLADILIGGVAGALLLLIFTSTIPGKLYLSLGVVFIAAMLLVRLDAEPNYVYLLNILRHFSYGHRYEKTFTDEELIRMNEEGEQNVAFEEAFAGPKKKKGGKKNDQQAEESESPKERRAREKQEKADDKLLADPSVPEEEKEAARQRVEERRERARAQAARHDADHAKNMTDVVAFTDIEDDLIDYGGKYYGMAIEIPPVEFRFFSEYRRANSIENALGKVLRGLPSEYSANIVKIERPTIYDRYVDREYDKLDELRESYEKGVLSESELQRRVEVVYDRINDLNDLRYDNKVVQPFYYLVLFDSDPQQLRNSVRFALESLRSGEMKPNLLSGAELAVFLKYTNAIDFDERDVEKIAPENYAAWAMPQSVAVKPRTVEVNHIVTHNMRVVNYPMMVGDAWLASLLSIPATKVVVKCRPMDRGKALKSIDRSLQELRGQWASTGVDSKRMELESEIDSLGTLLATLQGDNELLLDVNVYVTAYDIALTRANTAAIQPPPSTLANITNMKRVLRRTYQEQNIRLNNMEFNQMNAFVGAQVSGWDPMFGKGRGIPSNTVAAMYPWVFAHVSDENGIKLGSEGGVPVFIDFFRRDSERINSNMVIVGKSGSGKSYATKSILTNLAADDAKIFILDPENEYTELAANLHGKFINVGNAQFGRLNPFHIITSLDDDEEGGSTVSGSYATHLQFLEEFFRQIMSDCDKDAMEYLNSLIDRMYNQMDISAETDLSRLRPEDYPIFDDLYDAILSEFQASDNEYIRTMLRTLLNYVEKFATGGRNSNIWNGPSTVTTDENFTVFNFQSLLANRNAAIANAQMLLVLKYIDNEIIKNREYNRRYHMNRKVVVVIDEAHVFIDAKHPIALDFMFQLAKRIRKYNGMQIVITQNIKDFVGSEEIARKSTAIINACQYSFIFALAPNDMQDLCKLYEKAGGINEMEQEQIMNAPRGQAFTVMSPQSRSTFRVEVPDNVRSMFEEPDFITHYFNGEDGAANWEDYVGDSRLKREDHDAALFSARYADEEAEEEPAPESKHVKVLLTEVTEEEIDQTIVETLARKNKKSSRSSVFLEEIPSDTPTETLFSSVSTPAPAVSAVTIPPVSVSPAVLAPVAPQGGASDRAVLDALNAFGETQRALGELVNRLSYENMRESIARDLRKEMEQHMEGLRTTAPVQTAAPTETVLAPLPTENDDIMMDAERIFREYQQQMQDSEEESSDVDLFADEDEDEEVMDADDTVASLGSIFNYDALEEAARLRAAESGRTFSPQPESGVTGGEETYGETAEEVDEGDYVMAALMAAAEEEEEVNPIEIMQRYGEQTTRISLDQLLAYINQLRAQEVL